jgi:NACalpha-BTF3-like transcription factor
MAPPKSKSGGSRKSAGAPAPPKKIIEAIKEATGASEDDISAMLAECNYDANEATSRLVESK